MRIDKKYNKKIGKAVSYIKKQVKDWEEYEFLTVLGTGYNDIVNNEYKINYSLKYKDIPFFPICTAPYHLGNLVFASYKNKKVVFMQGRHHYYEGYNMDEIAFPIYVLSKMNIKYMLCTNAAASLNREKFKLGSICLVKDHVNGFFDNPILHVDVKHIKPRWLIPHNLYDKDLRGKILSIAKINEIDLSEGIYIGYKGGMFETISEAKFYKNYADMLSMSIIPEVIAAFHCDIKIAALSGTTVYCLGDNDDNFDETFIMNETKKIAQNIDVILKGLLDRL